MGNIKTRMIKTVAKQLVEGYPDLFTVKFEENKPIVQKFIDADSKRTLNKVAGAVTRVVKTKQKQQEAVAEVL
ncbi:MAG: 30S ribosomal protein S17e [Thermoprotei archaeon]